LAAPWTADAVVTYEAGIGVSGQFSYYWGEFSGVFAYYQLEDLDQGSVPNTIAIEVTTSDGVHLETDSVPFPWGVQVLVTSIWTGTSFDIYINGVLRHSQPDENGMNIPEPYAGLFASPMVDDSCWTIHSIRHRSGIHLP
jgi:hypothetical protein